MQPKSDKALGTLAPLFAMASGPDMTRGEVGYVITVQYRNVIAQFPTAVAKAGVLLACRGRTFRPAPHEVEEACKVERDALAIMVLRDSAKEVQWTQEEKERVVRLKGLERLEYGRRKWADHFGIDFDDYKACTTDLQKVRLLARWRRIEPAKARSPIEAEAARLAEAADIRRIV